MQNSVVVSILHGTADRFHNQRCRTSVPGLSIQLLLKITTIHEFQRKPRQSILLPHIKDLHDARMLQMRHSAGFRQKSLQCRPAAMGAGKDHFQRNCAFENTVASLIHDTHATPAQFLQNFVVTDHLTGGTGLLHAPLRTTVVQSLDVVFKLWRAPNQRFTGISDGPGDLWHKRSLRIRHDRLPGQDRIHQSLLQGPAGIRRGRTGLSHNGHTRSRNGMLMDCRLARQSLLGRNHQSCTRIRHRL